MTREHSTNDALEIINKRFYDDQPERQAQLQDAIVNDDVARKIRELREQEGLSQRQLAALINTQASVICRLEDADYEGHSLPMLNRIASALNQRVTVDFVPISSSQDSMHVSS